MLLLTLRGTPFVYMGDEIGQADGEIRQWANEIAEADAPDMVPFGVKMVGPVIYTFGNDEQKKRFLPDILQSNAWWCQGYSEPGAGSDVSAIAASAVSSAILGRSTARIRNAGPLTLSAAVTRPSDWRTGAHRLSPRARRASGRTARSQEGGESPGSRRHR